MTATPWGVDARPVIVEVDARNGLPKFQMVGLPDPAVRESRERVITALRNCGFRLPPRRVLINLAPADLRKMGTHLDLAIALGLLVAHELLPSNVLEGLLQVGELGLDGTIRPIRGALAIADLGARQSSAALLLPAANAAEAAALNALPVLAVCHLAEAVEHLAGVRQIQPFTTNGSPLSRTPNGPDLAEVRGQESAKRALEIAAGGGHNLLLIGPPGSGKTMLAQRLPGLLPQLTTSEAAQVTKIHSSVMPTPVNGLFWRRPFRAPHPGVSAAGLIGGGSIPRPGEASLAHCGVLFLDELPEFRRDALEALRQPLEEGQITVVRTRARLTFPARFSLVAAMNPCPCGHLGDSKHECRCPPGMIERYRRRISGPLLDRIDLHVEVPSLHLRDLRTESGEGTADVAARVARARQRQSERFQSSDHFHANAALGEEGTRRHCQPDSAGRDLLDRAFDRLALSARAHNRILKVARTIADLAGEVRVRATHVAEAIQYRALDRRMEAH